MALLLVGALLVVAGQAAYLSRQGSGRAQGESASDELRGLVLPEPAPKPDFTLTDTEGRPFDFRAETEGKLTLLSFGYTECPDICPVHMANLAAVLRELPYEARRGTRVVFTGDPAPDTAKRLRTWLRAFDQGFVGLRPPSVGPCRCSSVSGLRHSIADRCVRSGRLRTRVP